MPIGCPRSSISSSPGSDVAKLRTNLVAGLVAIAVMAVAVVALSGGQDTPAVDTSTATTAVDTASTATSTTIVDTAVVTFSDLDTVGLDELPDEALATLTLIERGGPYPYRQDDGTFENREGILPDRDRGHYREFTVDTPGSSDRGARRIVTGADGERYYTDDHYDSFREVVG